MADVTDPTLHPDLLEVEDIAPSGAAGAAELALVQVPIEPSIRKLMRRMETEMSKASDAFDAYLAKDPAIAVRMQKNIIELAKVNLACLELNAELYSRGAGVNRADSSDRPIKGSNGFSISADNVEGLRAIGDILAGKPIIDIAGNTPTPASATATTRSRNNS